MMEMPKEQTKSLNPKNNANTKRKNMAVLIGIICGVIVLAAVSAVLVLTGVFGGKTMVVGKKIKAEDITDFYYTYAPSSFPPSYQRYQFYAENGTPYFYHETREGENWPLTEDQITVSGTRELTEEEWQRFIDCINGGTVQKRTEQIESGGAGPSLFLYWKGDGSVWQEYAFLSAAEELAFEELCRELTE